MDGGRGDCAAVYRGDMAGGAAEKKGLKKNRGCLLSLGFFVSVSEYADIVHSLDFVWKQN